MSLRVARPIVYVALVTVGGLISIGRYVEEQERQRCEDAIAGRADLRNAIPGVVNEMLLPEAEGDDLEHLSVVVQRGRDYLEREYGDPPCAARLGLDGADADPDPDPCGPPPAQPQPRSTTSCPP